MPVFNPQRANILSTAGEGVARTGTIALQGVLQQADLQKQIDDIQYLREMRPAQIVGARLAAEKLQLEIERFKTLNSSNILAVQAQGIYQSEMFKLQEAIDKNRRAKAIHDYDQAFAERATEIIVNGDLDGLAELTSEIQTSPDINSADIAGSQYAPLNILKAFPEARQAQFSTIMLNKQIEQTQRFEQNMDEMIALDEEAQMIRRKQQEVKELEDIVGPISEMGAFGEKGSKGFKLNEGVQRLVAHITSNLSADPANMEQYKDDIKMLEWLSKIADVPKKRSLFRAFLGTRVFADRQYKRAQMAARTIGTFAQEIDSADPKRREAGIKGMQKYMKELIDRTTEQQVERPMTERLQEIERKRQEMRRKFALQQNPFSQLEPPVQPGQQGQQLPSFPDEASARAAGLGKGDRVIINGVPGTLGPEK